MAGELSDDGGHLALEKCVAGSGLGGKNAIRLVPPAIQDEGPEPGELRRDTGTEGATGALDRDLCFSRESATHPGTGSVVSQRHVPQFGEQRERAERMMAKFVIDGAGVTPGGASFGQTAERGMSNSERVPGIRG